MPDLNGDGVVDVEQVNACLVARGFNFAACAWRKAWAAVEGIKTFTLSTALAMLGLIDQLGGVDLLQKLKGQAEEGDNPRIGKYIMGVMVVFIVLSFLTKRKSDDPAATPAPAAAPAVASGGVEGETA
jgi:hypothetical protein